MLSRFEPHFFDRDNRMRKYRSRMKTDNEVVCGLREAYGDWAFDIPDLIQNPRLSFEKSPSYMIAPGVPYSIRKITPWTKVIITLRNPVDRLWSQYQMKRDRKQADHALEHLLAEEFAELRMHGEFSFPENLSLPFDAYQSNESNKEYGSYGLVFNSSLGYQLQRSTKRIRLQGLVYRGIYSHQLQRWLTQFRVGHNLLVIQFERLQQFPQEVMDEVLQFVGAPPHRFDDDALNHDHSPTKMRRHKRRTRDIMLDDTRAYLEAFYHPYNAMLATMLGPQWENVWTSGSIGGKPPTLEELAEMEQQEEEENDEEEDIMDDDIEKNGNENDRLNDT
jgi:hypothetical protein